MPILHGDLFNVLPTLEADSIEACVTDPPYGIGFMGKEWDTFSLARLDANKDSRFRQVDRSRVNHPNPNLRGRARSPAISPSQIEYNRSLAGQRGFQEWTARWAREVFRVLKPGAHLLVCGAPRSFHRMTCGLEDAGFEIRDCLSWLYGQGFPKSLNLGEGQGTALKPGWEPIVLARKPFNTTVAKNLQTHGTGGLQIDLCRLPCEKIMTNHGNEETEGYGLHKRTIKEFESHNLGRWPANVILDEDAADLLDLHTADLSASGDLSGYEPNTQGKNVYGEFKGRGAWDAYGDRGGASRFYYVAKPSREERDFGCEGLPTRSGGEACEGRAEGSVGLDSPRAGAGHTGGGRNIHPTVKPVELMRWLVKLITPPHGTVLDPFCGSGTTGMACRYELREFIGIEREAEYVDIAERRIAAVAPLFAGVLRDGGGREHEKDQEKIGPRGSESRQTSDGLWPQ